MECHSKRATMESLNVFLWETCSAAEPQSYRIPSETPDTLLAAVVCLGTRYFFSHPCLHMLSYKHLAVSLHGNWYATARSTLEIIEHRERWIFTIAEPLENNFLGLNGKLAIVRSMGYGSWLQCLVFLEWLTSEFIKASFLSYENHFYRIQ